MLPPALPHIDFPISVNAMAEALNGTFKAELIEMQGAWRDVDQVERVIFQWVTNARGPRRRLISRPSSPSRAAA
ncbi:hypothetical protein OIE49_36225 [Streptomyces sp. NBC_01788]|uniref:hypothetical protein n=1 Tax=Streptomyces sp. NBC_01788 TaxID=2975940 RepID=UPI002DDB024A|nr:hypothetical protein [Streptomyces sp. NBC_01788]WSB31430.1 hypothetical protein OIE49_36225 [Streptomyces sp. NBC_01788]